MPKLQIYQFVPGPPSRFVVIVARHLGLDFELKDINLLAGEHLTPEYKSISSSSTVPALVDGKFKLFDSSAMSIYLVEKYGKDDSLYPKDAEKKAKVNEKLFYVSGTVFPALMQAFAPVFYEGATEIPEASYQKFQKFNDTVEEMLQDDYLIGSTMTLADILLWSVIESWHRFAPLNPEKYAKYLKWIDRMRQCPFNDYQREGAEVHVNLVKNKLEANKQKK